MKIIDNIKHGWNNEDFVRIRKYMRKPAIIAFVISDIILCLLIFILLIVGKLEDLIVSMNVRYNSPAFIVLVVAFLIVQVGAVGYGVVLSLRKYRRPSEKGFFQPSYKDGMSYKALHKQLNFSSKILQNKSGRGI